SWPPGFPSTTLSGPGCLAATARRTADNRQHENEGQQQREGLGQEEAVFGKKFQGSGLRLKGWGNVALSGAACKAAPGRPQLLCDSAGAHSTLPSFRAASDCR